MSHLVKIFSLPNPLEPCSDYFAGWLCKPGSMHKYLTVWLVGARQPLRYVFKNNISLTKSKIWPTQTLDIWIGALRTQYCTKVLPKRDCWKNKHTLSQSNIHLLWQRGREREETSVTIMRNDDAPFVTKKVIQTERGKERGERVGKSWKEM